MRGSLFWRAFAAFLALTIATVALCTFALAAVLHSQRQEQYENEVRAQACEVAQYMAHLNTLSFVRDNTTMQYIIRNKINSIKENFSADIWIVSYSSGIVQYLDSNWSTSEEIATEAVMAQLAIIQSGREIRVRGLFDSLGDDMVTIGVPWFYSDGYVVGAVLLHISVDSLNIPASSLYRPFMLPVIVAILMGVLLSYFLARGQSANIKLISSSVRAFARGDFSSRVELNCGGEMQELGDTINEMTRALSELEDSRRAFVANVSHELRSPLTSMRGYVQGMLDGTIPEGEREKYLGVVMDETRRLTRLVSDLLNLSRIESGKFPMEKTSYDICEQIRRILIAFERRIDEKGADVEVDMPEKLIVTADQAMISQVLNNLIDNAVKFLPETGGRIAIRARELGGGARIEVEDNGEGIAAEDIPRVFERFFKADRAHAGMGTGLGLAIVSRILEQHGARAEVESASGRTVFGFTLAG